MIINYKPLFFFVLFLVLPLIFAFGIGFGGILAVEINEFGKLGEKCYPNATCLPPLTCATSAYICVEEKIINLPEKK